MKANDPRRQEVIDGITKLVESVFHGSYEECFKHYAGANSSYGFSEVKTLLHIAEVSNFAMRGLYATSIIEELDTDKDGRISWQEFSKAFSGGNN